MARPYLRPFDSFLRTVCYCKYTEGAHPYRKHNAVWTNYDWTPRPVCTKETPCPVKTVKDCPARVMLIGMHKLPPPTTPACLHPLAVVFAMR